MREIKFSDVDVTAHGSDDSHFGVGFFWKGYRHHWWSLNPLLTPENDTLYRNPIDPGLHRGDPGYFSTRQLSIAKNAEVVEAVRQHAIKFNLIAIGRTKEQQREAERVAKAKQEFTDHAITTIRHLAAQLGCSLAVLDDEMVLTGIREMGSHPKIARALARRMEAGNG
jgi:hypothetical protein